MISLVVAMAKNGTIGKDGDLPWRLPADLKHFKTVTMGKPIIMGRKTWDELGKPLPGRRNIVITRQHGFVAEGAEVVSSLDAALQLTAAAPEQMVIGGAQIYAQALQHADQIHRTLVEADVEGDTCFPELDWSNWSLQEESVHEADERHAWAMRFQRWQRTNA